MSYSNPADLFSALSGAPDLPGAACINKWGLFDPEPEGRTERAADTQQRHAQAVAICESCPVLAPCRDWLNGLPRGKRPAGVVAGRHPKPVGRPRVRAS